MQLPDLFRSKRWWTAVVAVVAEAIVVLLVQIFPDLVAFQADLMNIIAALFMTLLSGYIIQDGAAAVTGNSTKYYTPPKEEG